MNLNIYPGIYNCGRGEDISVTVTNVPKSKEDLKRIHEETRQKRIECCGKDGKECPLGCPIKTLGVKSGRRLSSLK